MVYVTVHRDQNTHQISFEDIFNGVSSRFLGEAKDTNDTYTYCASYLTSKVRDRVNCEAIYRIIDSFNQRHASLINEENKRKLYTSFKIPKRTGGFRKIDAPKDELKNALYELKYLLERHFQFTYHTAAFSYVEGRSTIDAVRRHQNNESRWILKTDLSKFFPSTTPQFLFKMLYQTFPLSEYVREEKRRLAFEKAMSLCFLDGGLPQGTPTSPMLTNQMMIPIDHAISKYCREHDLCYTRYADDMDFSSVYSFHWTTVVKDVGEILKRFGAPFSFNKEKIHYGSRSGRNWMLGLMLNKDNEITVGHANKKMLKTSLFCFGNSAKAGEPWSLEDTQQLCGLISYYKMVEGDKITKIINEYSRKLGVDLVDIMKKIIRGEVGSHTEVKNGSK